MPIFLREALIPSWQQVIGSVGTMIDKAEAFAADERGNEADLLQARLAPDMLPFAYQVKSCWTHSALAIEGARRGHFSPDMSPPPDSFAGLRAKLDQAAKALEAVSDAELEDIADAEMVFTIGDRLRLDFRVQDFLLSFSNPNFYFHAATAYDILRMSGVELGKRDFLGALRFKQR